MIHIDEEIIGGAKVATVARLCALESEAQITQIVKAVRRLEQHFCASAPSKQGLLRTIFLD